MTRHQEWERLSAYADGAMPDEEKMGIEEHLKTCQSCLGELEKIQETKLRLGRLPRHEAPADLIFNLRRIHRPTPWDEVVRRWFTIPNLWKPVGALAAAAILFFAVYVGRSMPDSDTISLEPLLAAHERYQAENLIPSADMAASNYSGRLAAYYSHEK